MSNRLSQLWHRLLGARDLSEKSSDVWISSTVTTGEATAGRHAQSPGKTFTTRATQYVLICAMKNAEVCASQRIRLYAPASAKSKAWKGRRLKGSTVAARRRIRHLNAAKWVGQKAADYAEYAEDIQEVTDHPVLDLLRKPNPWQSGTEFDELAYAYKELAGNAYINTYFDEAAPEMYMLGSQWVTIVPHEDQYIAGYLYDRNAASPHVFAPDDVIHMKHKGNPLNPYYGLGSLQAVLLEADLTAAATQSEWYRWQNGGRPDFAVEVDSATANNETARKQIKAEIVAETRGVKKAGRFLILGNSKIVPLGFKPRDMEFVAGLARSDDLIWAAFGVPQSEIKMNDANYASSITGNVQYLARTIAPRCCRHAQDLTEMLLPKFGEEPGRLWFAPDPIVPEDEKTEAEMDRLDVAAGILKINEARANRGLEEEEGGDVLRINGVSLERLDAPPVAPVLPGAEDGDEEDTNAEVVKVLAGLLEAKHDALQRQAVAPDSHDNDQGRQSDAEAHRGDLAQGSDGLKFYGPHLHTKDDDRVTGAPRGTIAAIERMTARLETWHRAVIADALAAGRTGTITVPSAELEKIINDELTDVLTSAAQAGAREVGGALEVAPESALSFLNTYKVRLSQAITADLSQSLNDAIRGGLEAGETYDQITTRVNAAAPEMARWRAERIARTETATATNEGRLFAWGELKVEGKRWLLSGNPCGICQAIALTYAGPIPVSQAFYKVGDTITGTDGSTYAVTWRDITGPPTHPGCACGLVPVLGA